MWFIKFIKLIIFFKNNFNKHTTSLIKGTISSECKLENIVLRNICRGIDKKNKLNLHNLKNPINKVFLKKKFKKIINKSFFVGFYKNLMYLVYEFSKLFICFRKTFFLISKFINVKRCIWLKLTLNEVLFKTSKKRIIINKNLFFSKKKSVKLENFSNPYLTIKYRPFKGVRVYRYKKLLKLMRFKIVHKFCKPHFFAFKIQKTRKNKTLNSNMLTKHVYNNFFNYHNDEFNKGVFNVVGYHYSLSRWINYSWIDDNFSVFLKNYINSRKHWDKWYKKTNSSFEKNYIRFKPQIRFYSEILKKLNFFKFKSLDTNVINASKNKKNKLKSYWIFKLWLSKLHKIYQNFKITKSKILEKKELNNLRYFKKKNNQLKSVFSFNELSINNELIRRILLYNSKKANICFYRLFRLSKFKLIKNLNNFIDIELDTKLYKIKSKTTLLKSLKYYKQVLNNSILKKKSSNLKSKHITILKKHLKKHINEVEMGVKNIITNNITKSRPKTKLINKSKHTANNILESLMFTTAVKSKFFDIFIMLYTLNDYKNFKFENLGSRIYTDDTIKEHLKHPYLFLNSINIKYGYASTEHTYLIDSYSRSLGVNNLNLKSKKLNVSKFFRLKKLLIKNLTKGSYIIKTLNANSNLNLDVNLDRRKYYLSSIHIGKDQKLLKKKRNKRRELYIHNLFKSSKTRRVGFVRLLLKNKKKRGNGVSQFKRTYYQLVKFENWLNKLRHKKKRRLKEIIKAKFKRIKLNSVSVYKRKTRVNLFSILKLKSIFFKKINIINFGISYRITKSFNRVIKKATKKVPSSFLTKYSNAIFLPKKKNNIRFRYGISFTNLFNSYKRIYKTNNYKLVLYPKNLKNFKNHYFNFFKVSNIYKLKSKRKKFKLELLGSFFKNKILNWKNIVNSINYNSLGFIVNFLNLLQTKENVPTDGDLDYQLQFDVRSPTIGLTSQSFIFGNLGFLIMNKFLLNSLIFDNFNIKYSFKKKYFSFVYPDKFKRSVMIRKKKIILSRFFIKKNLNNRLFSNFNLKNIHHIFDTYYDSFFSYKFLKFEGSLVNSCFHPDVTTHLNIYKDDFLKKGYDYTFQFDEIAIPRIRFEPGYQRLWRKARSALQEIIKTKFKYQYRLTNHLIRFYTLTEGFFLSFLETTLLKTIMFSRLLPDESSLNLFFDYKAIFLNGKLVTDLRVFIFVDDYIQFFISIWYYIFYRWLKNWTIVRVKKLRRLIFRKSLAGKQKLMKLKKQQSNYTPNWIFHMDHDISDIKQYLEVDYMTLSVYVVYDFSMLNFSTITNLYNSRQHIYRLYNWKYIN